MARMLWPSRARIRQNDGHRIRQVFNMAITDLNNSSTIRKLCCLYFRQLSRPLLLFDRGSPVISSHSPVFSLPVLPLSWTWCLSRNTPAHRFGVNPGCRQSVHLCSRPLAELRISGFRVRHVNIKSVKHTINTHQWTIFYVRVKIAISGGAIQYFIRHPAQNKRYCLESPSLQGSPHQPVFSSHCSGKYDDGRSEEIR